MPKDGQKNPQPSFPNRDLIEKKSGYVPPKPDQFTPPPPVIPPKSDKK